VYQLWQWKLTPSTSGKIVKAYEQGNTSIRKKLPPDLISAKVLYKNWLRWRKLKVMSNQTAGWKHEKSIAWSWSSACCYSGKISRCNPLRILQYWGETHGQWVSNSSMCRALKKAESDLKQDAVAKARQKSSEIEMSIGRKPKISTLKFSIFRWNGRFTWVDKTQFSESSWN